MITKYNIFTKYCLARVRDDSQENVSGWLTTQGKGQERENMTFGTKLLPSTFNIYVSQEWRILVLVFYHYQSWLANKP